MDDLEKTILDFVKKEYVEEADEEIDTTSPLISGGLVDSFSMVSLKRFLEKTYSINIPDNEASPVAFDTVERIANLVRRHQKG